jgi:hypothetical protein
MWKRFFSRKILLQKIFVPEETFTEKDFANYKIQTWIQEYFSTEKFPGHTSARQPPVLRKHTHAFSPDQVGNDNTHARLDSGPSPE